MIKIPSYFKNHFSLPVEDGNGVKFFDPTGKKYGKPHLGLDISWWTAQHLRILAAQRGTVVELGYDKTVGNYLVLQHDYDDNTHAWTSYIHLHELPGYYKRDANGKYINDANSKKQKTMLKLGDVVEMNSEVGLKGNTGASNGEHLHIYITKPTTAKYTWNTMRSLTIDPLTVLNRSKAFKYTYLGSYLVNLPFIEDVKKPVVYPKPVDRNETVKQVEVIMDVLRLRNRPGTNFDAYEELCKKGVYDIYEEKLDTEKRYLWYKIATIDGNEFWIASGGTRTQDLLPKLSEEEILRARVQELEVENAKLNSSVMSLSEDNIKLKDILLESNEINSNLAKINNDLVAKLDAIKEIVK